MKSRNGLVLVALTGLVSALVLLAAGSAPAADAGGTTAVSAVDFLNSIGVCVHVQHLQDASKLAAPLKYTGIRNVRDGADGNFDINGRIDNQAFKAASHENISGFDGLYGNHGKTWRKHFAGYSVSELASLPKVTTETGWRTDNTPAGDEFQGKMFMNVFLAQYKLGWKHTFLYEFTDDADGAFGFVKGDLTTTRKSATYFHNFTSILADARSLPAPGQLNYSMPNQPATVHDMLIEKSDGTFELAVWGEQVKGTNSVTVNLGGTYPAVKIYDPTIGTSPIQTLSNVSSVRLTLSDHVVIVELKSSPVVGLMSVSTALAAEMPKGNWVDVTPPKSTKDVQIVAAIPGHDKVIALSGTPHNGALAGLWSTTDKGASWSQAGIGAGSDPLYVFPLGMLLDPADPDTFWVWGNWIKFGKNYGNYKTQDGGTTIHSYFLAEFEGLSVDFSDPQRKTMVAGRHESSRAVERSTDGGKNWKAIGQSLSAGSAHSEYPLVIDSETYLIGCSFNKYGPQTLKGTPGIFRTVDGGRHWVSVSDKKVFQQPLVVHDTIYWAFYNGTNGGLLKSMDKGASWTEITPSGLAYTAQPILLPNASIATITAQNMIAVSTDGSAPWTNITPLIPLSKPHGLTYNAVGKAFFVWQKNGSVQRFDYTVTRTGESR